jgi:hypothetical protein
MQLKLIRLPLTLALIPLIASLIRYRNCEFMMVELAKNKRLLEFGFLLTFLKWRSPF